jgi:hypothetical protein
MSSPILLFAGNFVFILLKNQTFRFKFYRKRMSSSKILQLKRSNLPVGKDRDSFKMSEVKNTS